MLYETLELIGGAGAFGALMFLAGSPVGLAMLAPLGALAFFVSMFGAGYYGKRC